MPPAAGFKMEIPGKCAPAVSRARTLRRKRTSMGGHFTSLGYSANPRGKRNSTSSSRDALQLFLLSATLAVGLVACAGGPGASTTATVTTAVPSITSLNPNSGVVGTSVTITGTNFGATQGTSTVTFSGTVATPTSWSATSIVVPIPTGATTGNVVVTVGGVSSAGVAFTVLPTPSITSLSPTSGLVGVPVTITGTSFGATQGASSVKFNGITATPTSWSATSIVVPVPTGATTGSVVVTVGGVASNSASFTVTIPAPSITSLNPNSGAVGTSVTITGTNFGTTQGTSTITFNGTAVTPASWSASSIVAPVPAGAATGNVVVTVGGQASNGAGFTVTAYPLKVSANKRYLVDQKNVPFLILGDSPQSLLVNLSTADRATYMADRQARGFNSILVMALCDTYTGGNSSGTTYDNIAPFTTGSFPSTYDLSTPNAAYFARLDALISTAASYGLVVFLDPIETGGWLTTLRNNDTTDTTKAYNYGAFLGNRYKNSPNIVWDNGNDFQTWNISSSDNNLVYQVMAGIASADPNHVQTIELNYFGSYSNQDTTTIGSDLTLDSAYTYYETYAEVLGAYNSPPTLPTFLTEANYEYENNNGFFTGLTGVFILREQEYWTMTSGACGQLYGNHYTWQFLSGWQNFLDSPGTLELAYWTKLFNSIPWWNLVPDQSHQIVTSGYGTPNGSNGNLPTANYATTAWITDGSVAIVYDPAGNTLTVNLAKFNQPVTAAWYDPSNGIFTIIGSPFPNSGMQQFMPPGKNHDGDSDWVLVFEVTPVFP
jgi:uncharacterized protein DUF4038/IPT/TIG domain-containing protein/collagenase-like protein with putative collagen-binding domain